MGQGTAMARKIVGLKDEAGDNLLMRYRLWMCLSCGDIERRFLRGLENVTDQPVSFFGRTSMQ